MASEMVSQTLSGWPSPTDSEEKMNERDMVGSEVDVLKKGRKRRVQECRGLPRFGRVALHFGGGEVNAFLVGRGGVRSRRRLPWEEGGVKGMG